MCHLVVEFLHSQEKSSSLGLEGGCIIHNWIKFICVPYDIQVQMVLWGWKSRDWWEAAKHSHANKSKIQRKTWLEMILGEAQIPWIRYWKASCYTRNSARLQDNFFLQITCEHCRPHWCNVTDSVRTAAAIPSHGENSLLAQQHEKKLCNSYHNPGYIT